MQISQTFQEFSKKESAFQMRFERDISVQPKFFDNSKYLSFYVRIYLDIPEKLTDGTNKYSLEDISFVKYELDKSYKDNTRISENASAGFEIKVWTYGYYDVQAIVFPKYGPSFKLNGFLRFPVTEDEKQANIGRAQDAV